MNNKMIFFLETIGDDGYLLTFEVMDSVIPLMQRISNSSFNFNISYKIIDTDSIKYSARGNEIITINDDYSLTMYNNGIYIDDNLKLMFKNHIFVEIDGIYILIDMVKNDKDVKLLCIPNNIEDFIEKLQKSNIYNDEQINLLYSIYNKGMNKSSFEYQLSNIGYSKEEFCAIMNIGIENII